jgi:hypothetical protein
MLGLNGLRPLVLALALSGGGLWSTLVDQLANLSGAGCHAIESWHVQLKGAPFCQATTGSGEYYAQGRTQRVIAATALGVTISFFTSRSERQRLYVAHRQRLDWLEKTVSADNDREVQVPSEALRTLHAVSPDVKVQYRLSTATLLAFGGDLGITASHTASTSDPVEAALIARGFAGANALDQTSGAVVTQTAPRAADLASGGVKGAEVARQAVEAQTMMQYLLSTQGIARAQHVQIGTYRILKTERQQLFADYFSRAGTGVTP